MLEELKKQVCEQNLRLKSSGLVVLTWGNASAIDRATGLVVIKPSGVSYDEMKPEDMVVVDLDGKVVEGDYRPSSDTPTHLYLYKKFSDIGGIVHTHSTCATAFAQAGMPILPFGTTHADTFFGAIPVTRPLSEREVNGEYEYNTGVVIGETFESLDYNAIPAVLVKNHAPFTWGKSCDKAVENSIILEEVASMALKTMQLNPSAQSAPDYLMEKHYMRKHGKNAYYGQSKK